MSKKDTQKDEPVSSLEDDISKVIDQAEEIEDERDDSEATETTEIESVSADDTDDVSGDESDTGTESDETDETDQIADDDADTSEDSGEESADDLAASAESETDRLEAPEHWSAVDRETFNEQPKAAQEFILKRHKEIEGDYTRKRQQESSQVRLAESVTDALAPYRQEFASAGLDEAGAVRRLASVHQALKTDGKSAILNLAQTYGIDLSEESQEYADPALRQTQSQLSAIEQRIARQEQAAQQEKQQALISTIKAFEEAKGEDGKLLHPHFQTLQGDITALFNAGLAKDLGEGYNKALSMRPDLMEKPKAPKVSQAEKVAKAKKAATGIKSSGAVGKRPAKTMSLEDEIASLIP